MLEIRLLGEQSVMVDGVALDVQRSTRTLGLLGYLVAHAGIPQLRQHVAGMFWPESSEAQARTNLRRELHQLRAALPHADRCVAVDNTTVSWCDDAPCVVDLVEFQRAAAAAEAAAADGDEGGFAVAAARAVRAFGGELLPGLYDEWVVGERDRLRRSCVGLLDRLVGVLAEQGEMAAAIGHAGRWVELEPLEESGYRTLMTLQARNGDRAAALRTFHRCSSALEGELGVEPDPETVAVYKKLFAPPAERVSAAPMRQHAAPLVGRDVELEALHTAWAGVAHGPGVVVVAGEAGVGKTRLAAELADGVERGGGVVARARCFGSGGRLALAPAAEWLRSSALRPGVEQLDPAWRVEVGRLVPELGPGGEREPSPPPLADAWRRRQFFEGLARAVLAAEQPTLLVLDDLQWCDTETLAWLELLVHVDPDAPLLVVATLRSEELDDNPEVAACRRRLRATGTLRELELAPLTVEETSELAAALGGHSSDEGAMRQLAADTGGFPLFVVESLREGSTRPSRTDAVLAGRLAQLSAPAEELAGLAAAVGRDISLELLAAVGDVDVDTLVGAVDELWRRRLLREHSAATYDFSHDLLRAAAYERLTPPHRRLLHRRVAAGLEQVHAGDLDAVAAQIADQHERGGQPDRAIRFHARAASAATGLFAHDDAVDHYERALELLSELPTGEARDRRELELREAMVGPLVALRGYAAPSLGTALERMGELGERLGAEAVTVRSQAARSAYLTVQGRIREALALTGQLMGHATTHPEQMGQLYVARGWSLASFGRPHDALELFAFLEEHTDVAEVSPLGFPVGVMARSWRAHTRWLVGQAHEAATSAAAALELAEELDHPFGQAIAHGYAAITHCLLGDVEGTVELAASVRRLCDRYGFAYYGEWSRILQGWATGGADGEALIREGLERLQRQHAGRARPFWLFLLAEVLTDAGHTGEASRVLADARTWADEHGDVWWLAELWRADAALRPDDETEAMLAQALAVAGEQRAVALELRAATDLARLRLEAGHPSEAIDLLEPVRARAGGCNPADVADADAVLGHPLG